MPRKHRQSRKPAAEPLTPHRPALYRPDTTPADRFDVLAYNYYAYVPQAAGALDIYDGDTINLMVDLGRNTWQGPEYHRLYGIDTPEIRPLATRPAAIAARAHLAQLIAEHPLPFSDPQERTWLLIRTHKSRRRKQYRRKAIRGSFGRWLVELFGYRRGELVNLNQRMIDDGFAKVYEG